MVRVSSIPVQLPRVYRPEPLTSGVLDTVARIRTLDDIVYAARSVQVAAEKGGNASAVREAHRAFKHATLERYLLELKRGELENALAREVNAVQSEEYPIPEYTAGTLGSATYLGQAETGTPEWHALRQNGIGGSQILDAAGFEEGENGHLRPKSVSGMQYGFQDILAEKTDDAETLVSDTNDAAERGHLWEPVLLDVYRRATGTNVSIGKQTWQGSRKWQVVNVDGIVLDDNGVPEGLVECKNSNRDATWAHGVPLKYRAQLLYYLDATGLSYGDIIWRVNGDVQYLRILRGEPIDPNPHYKKYLGHTITDLIPVVEETWGKVSDVKEELVTKDDYWKSGRKPVMEEHSVGVGEAVNNLWALLHYEFDRGEISASVREMREEGMSLTEAAHSLIHTFYDPSRLGSLVGLDGETAAIVGDVPHRPFLPGYSDWIETGVAVINPDGTITTHARRHGADHRIIEVNGTGAEHVHRIRREDIEGLPLFIDDTEWLYRLLKPADVIVVHNASFEKKHIKPIMFDIATEKPWLDTKWLVKHFVPENRVTDANKLADFVAAHDIEYANAHRAYVDARMMMEALQDFLKTFPDF